MTQKKFNGFLLINKPQGLTSHDVVFRVRKIFLQHKVGHAGTLDPLATGVLLLGIGSATKKLGKFLLKDKKYRAQMCLGISTDTQDISGKILEERPFVTVNLEKIHSVFKKFLGPIEQIPPMFSAKKVKGQKLYQLARKGISIERKPIQVTIHQIKLRSFREKYIEFDLSCSKGTYVRTLCHDIGEILKTGACLSNLVRLKIGSFDIKETLSLETLSQMDAYQLSQAFISTKQLCDASF